MSDILTLTEDLISFKTVAKNNDEILRCYKYIENYFKDTNYTCKLLECDGNYSMLISNTEENDFDIIFNGHIDIVPAEDRQFSPKVKDGYLFGRGAIDMKAQIACIMHTLKNYHGTKKLCALFTADEEVGGENGVKFCLEMVKPTAKVAIVPDGGENFDLVISCRGLFQFEVETIGISAHASELELGRNAVLMCYDIFNKINDILDKNCSNHTVNLSSISTPNTAFNKVPDRAKMKIDIRYDPECPIQNVIDYLNSLENATYKIVATTAPMAVDPENKYVKLFIKCAENIIGRPVNKIACFGATDGRFFVDNNIPVIMMNPNGYDLHGENERLEISTIYTLSQIYDSYLYNFEPSVLGTIWKASTLAGFDLVFPDGLEPPTSP